MYKNSAFIVVDAQRGFSDLCPEELPVPGAFAIMPIINNLLVLPWKYKFATQDWHPKDHCSFKEFGGLYPPHCVQNTDGARFLPGLKQEEFHAIFRKAFRKNKDAYSFFVDHPHLKQGLHGLDAIYLTGICTNICVYETAMDLSKYVPHVPTYIIEDACATLSLPEDNPYCPSVVKGKAMSNGIGYITSELKEVER
jgi:nicotinamidase/pyrazinamidase